MSKFEVKAIQPMKNDLVTTAKMYIDGAEKDANGLYDVTKIKKGLNEYQKVVAVGPQCSSVKVGDVVVVNPARFAQKRFEENSLKADVMENVVVKYNFPMIEMNGENYLLLNEYSDIKFVVTEFEDPLHELD